MVVYDPDPNPKNEEQAIARAHRIGQTKEVRVIHFEAVADAPDDSMYTASAPQVGALLDISIGQCMTCYSLTTRGKKQHKHRSCCLFCATASRGNNAQQAS